LLETQLARESGLPPESWHTAADRGEHTLTPEDANRLADALGNPRFDPHGDPIPDRDGRLAVVPEPTLLEWPPGQPALIVHLEDEPPALFAHLSAAGLAPGMIVTPGARTATSLALAVDGRIHPLTPVEAELVHVVAPTPERLAANVPRRRLADLAAGATAVVAGLTPVIRGRARQRLLDLGFVPGTRIQREFTAALRSPVAYRVRGTLIALRREQTEHILIEAPPAPATP
jgi:DtxR family Mn-dependent transcriptional regulator